MVTDAPFLIQGNTLNHDKLDVKVTYHPLYSMNKFVTNKSKSPQGGVQVFPYMG